MSAVTRHPAKGLGKRLSRNRPKPSTEIVVLDEHFVESVTTFEDGSKFRVIVGRGSLDLPAPVRNEPTWFDPLPTPAP